MKNKIIIILLVTFQISFAQKKDENIGTEVVNVVKPYSPTVSDANKIKEVPAIDDEETTKKQSIKYQIFSFPVASTFKPSKGKAAGIDKAKQEGLFSNYVTLGFGNYATANAELFVTHELDKYQYLGGMFRHQSSQGGINGTVLDDNFGETSADILYGYQRQETRWIADIGYKNEVYNWYGVPLQNPVFQLSSVNDIKPKHNFNTAKFSSELTVLNSFFNKLTVDFVGFWDNNGSKENRFIIKPDFTFSFDDTAVKAKFGIDYLNTKFDTSYLTQLPVTTVETNIEKSNFIFNVNPSFQILKDDLSVEIGADLVYFSRLKDVFTGIESESSSKFFIYPKINVSYKVVGDLMIAFGTAEGKLIQNSYADFSALNKFISPTLLIEPTNQNLELVAGLRGKLASMLSYNVKAAYNSAKSKAMFKSNPYSQVSPFDYSFGNSYQVVYDNVRTISFGGELKADVNKDITLGLNAEGYRYTTDFEKEAWNLPTFKAAFTADFNIGQKWYAGSQLFFVGERKDEFTNVGFVGATNTVQTIESYFDINAHIGYKHNARLTAFLKGNNLANQNYERWLNYPVQGVQVLLGASYKFDF